MKSSFVREAGARGGETTGSRMDMNKNLYEQRTRRERPINNPCVLCVAKRDSDSKTRAGGAIFRDYYKMNYKLHGWEVQVRNAKLVLMPCSMLDPATCTGRHFT